MSNDTEWSWVTQQNIQWHVAWSLRQLSFLFFSLANQLWRLSTDIVETLPHLVHVTGTLLWRFNSWKWCPLKYEAPLSAFSFRQNLTLSRNAKAYSKLIKHETSVSETIRSQKCSRKTKQEVKVIWQKAPHGGPIPRLGVTPGGRKLYHWIPGVGFPISVP